MNDQTGITGGGPYTLDGLKPAASHYLRIRAFNEHGVGPWSKHIGFATKASEIDEAKETAKRKRWFKYFF